MLLLLRIINTYIKENIIYKITKSIQPTQKSWGGQYIARVIFEKIALHGPFYRLRAKYLLKGL